MNDMLIEMYMTYGYSKERGISVVRPGKSGADEIAAMMVNFRENPQKEIAGSPVVLIKDFQLLEETCLDNIRNYDYLYYIPFDYGWQENNGVRTANKEFQWMVDGIIRNVIERWNLQVRTPVRGNVEKIASQIAKETVSIIPGS